MRLGPYFAAVDCLTELGDIEGPHLYVLKGSKIVYRRPIPPALARGYCALMGHHRIAGPCLGCGYCRRCGTELLDDDA